MSGERGSERGERASARPAGNGAKKDKAQPDKRALSPAVREALKRLPAVDEAVRRLEQLDGGISHWALVEAARAAIDERRRALVAGKLAPEQQGDGELDWQATRTHAHVLLRPSLRRVYNATGVVLHTNLGRAPIAPAVLERFAALRDYSNLEYDLEAGRRGSRHHHASALLRRLTGAEDAAVVNNNAAAVMLCLAAHARGREVIVSRGELVEIGGSFRMPDVMEVSGAKLREVGTTNRTHARDYQSAIGDETAMLLKVHRSNFAVVGFTAEVPPDELAAIGRERGVLTMYDVGSGSLFDLTQLSLPAERTVPEMVKAGFDLVTFSGDKLLGGPQAGIIVGRAEAVAAARAHPLMRALRPDKLTIAALEVTLEAYRDGRARQLLPALQKLGASDQQLLARAESLVAALRDALGDDYTLRVTKTTSRVGGGSLPQAAPRSRAVVVDHVERSADALAATLRAATPPVIARIEDDALLFDVRTLADDDLADFVDAVARQLSCRGARS